MKCWFSHSGLAGKAVNYEEINCLARLLQRKTHPAFHALNTENTLHSQTCYQLFSTNPACFSDSRQFSAYAGRWGNFNHLPLSRQFNAELAVKTMIYNKLKIKRI
jgi:hypothetical protein